MSKVQKGRALVDTTADAVAPPAQSREALFDELVATQRDRAVAMAYHLVGDLEAAKDVAQDAFVSAYRGLAGYRGDAKLSTWFMRILINRAHSYRRGRWLRDRWTELTGEGVEGIDDGAPPPGDPALRRRIARALDELSPPQRAVFAMVHLEGMTVREAADVLGKPTGTVKSHLHRALTALRRRLADLEAP
jgi:RNA polymerase sigma-70 factor (ECF subfamily)